VVPASRAISCLRRSAGSFTAHLPLRTLSAVYSSSSLLFYLNISLPLLSLLPLHTLPYLLPCPLPAYLYTHMFSCSTFLHPCLLPGLP